MPIKEKYNDLQIIAQLLDGNHLNESELARAIELVTYLRLELKSRVQ